jgi:site-specific recombinase XerD
MNKSALISKYKHTLTLKNYSQSTVNSYLNGLHKFLAYVQGNEIEEVKASHISEFLVHAKRENDYSYSTMSQGLLWRNNLSPRYASYTSKY